MRIMNGGPPAHCVQLPRKNSATRPLLCDDITSAMALRASAFLTRMWPTDSVSTSDCGGAGRDRLFNAGNGAIWCGQLAHAWNAWRRAAAQHARR